MKKVILVLMIAAGLFSACNEDEPVVVKDYGLKTFEADLKFTYIPGPDEETPPTTIYAQQVYFKFGEENAVATGELDTETWTDFNVFNEDSADYNATSDVADWDLVLTSYVGNGSNPGDSPEEYSLVGLLQNSGNGITAGKMEYTDSEEDTAIAEAFANLTLADVPSLQYSSDPDAIGYNWKAFSLAEMKYTIHTNWFYIVKLSNGDTYKLRVIGFYGSSTSERIIKFEYQLMQ